jgi:hypothetical protein
MDLDDRTHMADGWCEANPSMPTSASADANWLQFALASDYWQLPPTSYPSELPFGEVPDARPDDLLDAQESWFGSQKSPRSLTGTEIHGRISRSDSGYSSMAGSYASPSPLQSVHESAAMQAHCSTLNLPMSHLPINETISEYFSPTPSIVDAASPSAPAAMYEVAKTSYDLEQGLNNDRLSFDARLSLTQSSLAKLQHVATGNMIEARSSSLQLMSGAIMLLFQHYEHVVKELQAQQTTSEQDLAVIDPTLVHQPAVLHNVNSSSCLDPSPDEALNSDTSDGQSLTPPRRFRLGSFELDATEHSKVIGRILRRDVRHCLQLCRVSNAEDAGMIQPLPTSLLSAYSLSLLSEVQSFAVRLEVEFDKL